MGLSWFPDAAGFYRLAKNVGIRLYGGTSGKVGLKPPSTADDTDYTLPATKPIASNYVLACGTDGVTSWIDPATVITGLAAVAYSGAYSDLIGKPLLGSASTRNDSYFLQAALNLSDLANVTAAKSALGLATVASTGAYSDLTGTPNLALYAPIASPTFTGTPRVPTATSGTNDTTAASTQFVNSAITTGIGTLGNMSLQNKTAVDIQGGTISGCVVTGLANATNSTDALPYGQALSLIATGIRQYLDTDWFFSTNVNIVTPGAIADNGNTVNNGDRILLTGQSTGLQNGPWVFNGAASALTRPNDYLNGSTQSSGLVYRIEESGSSRFGYQYVLNTNNVTVGTTSTSWGIFSGPYSGTSPIQVSGQVISLLTGQVGNSYLTNSAITIAGTSVSLGGTISQDSITGLSATGLIKRTAANTLAIATPGTDYGGVTSGALPLAGNNTGGFTNITVDASLSWSTPTLALNLTNANSWTGAQTFQFNSIGITQTPAVILSNITASTALLDQNSPCEQFDCTYYNGGVSKTHSWRVNNQSSNLTWVRNDNGAGYGSPIMALTNNGTLIVANVSCSNSITTDALNASGSATFSGNGAASTPGLLVSGTPYTAGNATTNFPQLYINSGSAVTSFSTTGTMFGINAPSLFTGKLMSAHVNGAAGVMTLDSTGNLSLAGGCTASNGLIVSNIRSLTWNGTVALYGPETQTLRIGADASGTNISGVGGGFRTSSPTGTGTPGIFFHSAGFTGLSTTPTVTITNASPAVFTITNHGFVPGQSFRLTTTGTLPTGLAINTTYYVKATGITANTFQASATASQDGAALNTSSAGSGTHTLTCQTNVVSPAANVLTIGYSGLTGSQATQLFNLQQWWNTSGTPSLIKANAIDIASNASSLLLDIMCNSVDQFTVDKTGNTYVAGTFSGYKAKQNVQSGTTYTLTVADSGSVIEFTSNSAVTLTLPNNLTQGINCRVVQKGTGQVTVSPASGATCVNRSSFTKTAGQYAEIDLYVTTNVGGTAAAYILGGDGAT